MLRRHRWARDPGHGMFFKWSSSSMKVRLHDNVFMVEQLPNNQPQAIDVPPTISCRNNVLVWFGRASPVPCPTASRWCATAACGSAPAAAWLERHPEVMRLPQDPPSARAPRVAGAVHADKSPERTACEDAGGRARMRRRRLSLRAPFPRHISHARHRRDRLRYGARCRHGERGRAMGGHDRRAGKRHHRGRDSLQATRTAWPPGTSTRSSAIGRAIGSPRAGSCSAPIGCASAWRPATSSEEPTPASRALPVCMAPMPGGLHSRQRSRSRWSRTSRRRTSSR